MLSLSLRAPQAMMNQMNAANAIPHFAYCDEVMMDELIATRAALKPIAERYGIPKFTLMPLMIKVREELLSRRFRFFSLTPHRSHSLTHS